MCIRSLWRSVAPIAPHGVLIKPHGAPISMPLVGCRVDASSRRVVASSHFANASSHHAIASSHRDVACIAQAALVGRTVGTLRRTNDGAGETSLSCCVIRSKA
jgi:hypothetical protein